MYGTQFAERVGPAGDIYSGGGDIIYQGNEMNVSKEEMMQRDGGSSIKPCNLPLRPFSLSLLCKNGSVGQIAGTAQHRHRNNDDVSNTQAGKRVMRISISMSQKKPINFSLAL